ncbi:MAG: DUF2092 domain-containing protein [Chthoniobacterales bacterium]
MNYKTSLLSLGLLGVALLPATAQKPSADAILREMSTTLAAAQTFSFSGTRQIDAELLGDVEVPVKSSKICVLVQRPDKLAIRSTSNAGTRQFIADGRTLTIYGSKDNLYSVSRIPGSLDALVDELDAKYGFTPPLADYAVSNPYAELRKSAHTAKYLGREKVGGCFLGFGSVACEHIALIGDEADAELWIGVRDHLPRKLVATFKLLPTKPQLIVEFRNWNLAAHATAADFTFTPPKGAMEIEMWTVSKMQQAGRKH